MPRLALLLLVACSSKREPPPAPTPPPPVALAPEAFWTSLPELPPGTFDVWVSAETLDEAPIEQQWAFGAQRICAEHDPFVFPIPGREDHVREGIACGRALIEHVPGQVRTFMLEVNRPAREFTSPLYALRTTYAIEDLESLVVGFRKEGLGDTTVLCRPFDPSQQTCAQRRNAYDKAIAIVGGHVIGGTYAALADLIGWSERDRILGLLPDLGARPNSEVDLVPRGSTWMLGPRRFLAFSREESDPLASAIREHARAVVIDNAWGIGSFSLQLVPRCSTKACPERAALADALRTYQQAWAREAPARLVALFDEGGPSAHCTRPVETAMVAAAAKAPVTVTSVVELRVAVKERTDPTCDVAERERIAKAVALVRAAN